MFLLEYFFKCNLCPKGNYESLWLSMVGAFSVIRARTWTLNVSGGAPITAHNPSDYNLTTQMSTHFEVRCLPHALR